MTDPAWRIVRGTGSPLVATAIHDGHAVRPEVAALLALDDAARLREEDPFTSRWVGAASTQIVGLRSRFEFDLNRPRQQAVYVTPEDAWGLEIWRSRPDEELIARSLEIYDAFYREVHELLSELVERFGKVVVLDLHSYNYRRSGPNSAPADPAANPEVNLGTASLDREIWGPIVETALSALREFDFVGRRLDVRENVKFQGGQFVRWMHQEFPTTVCGLAIEFKKTFMDEWTGQGDSEHVDAIGRAVGCLADRIGEGLGTL
ncbi:MAG: N-formylglutamate amidohydrolase [Pirellulales bacterium]|nr:N-formylglutamate amidohydrolase [Pirellulales bacterium]